MIVLDVAERAAVTDVAFAAGATAVRATTVKATSYSSTVRTTLWDVAAAREWDAEAHAGSSVDYQAPCRHPSGLWSFWSGQRLMAYRKATGKTVTELISGYSEYLAITPDGRTLLFDWCGVSSPCENGYASRTWSDAGKFGSGFSIVADPPAFAGDLRRTCCGLAPLPGGDRFMTVNWRAFGRPRLAVRAVATGQVLTATDLDLCDRPVLTVAPDGALAAVAVTRTVFVFTTGELNRPLRTVRNDSRKHFTAVAFHPSGRYLAAASNDATVKLYDTTTWEVARTFTWDIGRMRSIAFSPDGTLAAAGSDKGKVVVWDVDV